VKVVLFFTGLGKRGGISPDVHHLAAALTREGIHPKVTGNLIDLLRSKSGRGTIVNVYGCLPSVKTLGAMLLVRAKRQRLVWTPVFHPRRRAIWKGSGPYRIMALFDRVAPRIARITHAVSAATAEEAEFFTAIGAPQVEVIPLVVSETHRRLEGENRTTARRSLGLRDGPVVLLIASHSPRRKGMEFASHVLAELRMKLPRVTFLVVGGGDLGALAAQPGVKAVGWCEDDQLLNAYRSADVLFVPSRYEQFSRATIEAWACELPVVLSDGVALAPVAESSRAGIVVPFEDVSAATVALAEVLTSQEWRLHAGRRGRELVDGCFLRDGHLRATLSLYQAAGWLR
jgi:glycosyltransferase involved in cell wall biosynthesis